MPYGNPSKPSRIYSFPARIAKEDEEQAMAILHQSNNYCNELIHLEIQRRQETDAVLIANSKKLADIEETIKQHKEIKEDLIAQSKKIRIQLRTRKLPEDLEAQIAEQKKILNDLYKDRKKVRDPLFKVQKIKNLLKPINDAFEENKKAARAACGLHDGTYLQAELSRSKDKQGAPPRHSHFDGEGKIAVQIKRGEYLRNAHPGGPANIRNYLQIDPLDASLGLAKECHVGRIRIGSCGTNRGPVWLPFTARMYRELPEDAHIKWAWLLARRVGTRTKWSLQLTLARDEWPQKRCGVGSVAIMPGWTMEADGLRVASWYGTDGDRGHLVIPNDIINRSRKCKELESIRSRNLNDILERMVKMLVKAPDWMADDVKTMPLWRSPARLAKFIHHWRENRFKGDSHAYAAAEAWRKQDKHLYEWLANQKKSVADWRKTFYREFAVKMSDTYAVAIFPDIKWSEFARKKDEDDTPNDVRSALGECRKLASVYSLTEIVAQAMDVDKVKYNGIKRCGLCNEKSCTCNLPKWENETINLLRRSLREEQLSQFFTLRSNQQRRRMEGDGDCEGVTA